MNVIERTRSSGKCPPSLFRDEPKEESFEAAVAKIIDPNELMLSVGGSFGTDFEKVMQMGNSSVGVQGDPDTQGAILAQRRCVILAIVGSTPGNNSSLTLIMESGFLSSVKLWLDDILSGLVGGVDLLLHLLSNIVTLPVTKSNVKDSGMGKAIGSIEKHKMCMGTPNEASIKERVLTVKSAWQKSVKLLKEKNNDVETSSVIASGSMGTISKRELDASSKVDLAPLAKKARTEDKKKSSSLSSLLNKVKPDSDPTKKTNDESAVNWSGDTKAKLSGGIHDDTDRKKQKLRVKWQDHFGGELTLSKTIDSEGEETKPEEIPSDGDVSWTDRKKRDRLREKELLSRVKKAKLMDDDGDDMGMETMSAPPSRGIQPTTAWNTPALLPERPDAPPPQVNSSELAIHTARMASVVRVQYLSEHTVPSSPAPMSDVEQALDMTNQSSTVTQSIPFFVPQLIPAAAPVIPILAAAPAYAPPAANGWMMPVQPPGLPPMQTATNSASLEFVQSLGLPMFLVGQDTQALQTLAATPSLLSTFVDNNGMYDQARLTSLVHTLSQSSSSLGAVPSPMGQMGGTGFHQNNVYGAAPPPAYHGVPPAANTGIYGPASTGIYGPATDSAYGGGGWQNGGPSGGFKGRSDDGNLHVSGYGPSTTQADVINLFMPYVKVDEVVMKANFAFVNTSDPTGAARAIDSLTGVLLGGMPIRINPATRRNKTTSSAPPPFAAAPAPNPASIYGSVAQSIPGLPPQIPPMMGQGVAAFPPPVAPPQTGTVDVENARDDRGNPATKNLFVAGYGQGTTEFQLRELFGQYAQILAIITKGSFSFVNTADKAAAVRARDFLSGTMLNGGVLRINFAKESGRLGTSFDVTYNGGGRPPPSHYGRR